MGARRIRSDSFRLRRNYSRPSKQRIPRRNPRKLRTNSKPQNHQKLPNPLTRKTKKPKRPHLLTRTSKKQIPRPSLKR